MGRSHRSGRATVAIGMALVAMLALSQTALAAHAVRHSGTGHIMGTWTADFDKGLFNTGGTAGDDLQFNVASETDRSLETFGSTKILRMGTAKPSYGKCSTAHLTNRDYRVTNTTVGKWFCLQTKSGRFVRFRVDDVEPYPGGIDLTFVTWEH